MDSSPNLSNALVTLCAIPVSQLKILETRMH